MNLGRDDINFTMSLSSLNISIPRPWFAAAGLTSQILFAQCFIGILSLGQNPLDKSLNREKNSLVSESSRFWGTKNVVGVESKT